MVARATSYEARVAREIDVWVKTPPSIFNRVVNQTSRPIASAVGRIIPKPVVRAAVSSTYHASRWLADPQPVVKAAGVADLICLRDKSLELSDQLSRKIGRAVQALAIVDGVLTGTGGLVFAPLDVAALTLLALYGIHRTGHCYGYALDQPQDRAYMLAILTLAGTQSLRVRRELHGMIGDFRSWVLARTIESVAVDSLTQQFVRIVCVESIPGLGAVMGSLANLAFMRQVLTDCRRVFQERWLRENGLLCSRCGTETECEAGDDC